MENKVANFKRISENRKQKILGLLAQLTNLSNTSFYEYTDQEIIDMFDEIEEQCKKTKELLLKTNDKKNRRVIL